MERQPVKSSQIRSVGYNPELKVLDVEFGNGYVYQYSGVSQELFDQLMAAESIGKFFLQNIRPIFECHKLPQEENLTETGSESL